MERFTEREKELIAGALLAQMINVSKSTENIAQTGDKGLTEALQAHAAELRALHDKVCGMMTE
jgi:hypothetical protein